MPEDKDSGNSGGWFPNLNQLLLVLLAGALFASQNPFHESRPDKSEKTAAIVHAVSARPWQDPFEAVGKDIENPDKTKKLETLENIQGNIENKKIANHLSHINVVAVMLPGSPYFEDGETRRRLRYAVLSGFDAALNYMPESDTRIQYFFTEETNDFIASPVAYEWMVYKPTHHDNAPADNERPYERAPVLLLWLNSDNFSITPHQKLKQLLDSMEPQNKMPKDLGNVSVLGPYDSEGLQDLVNEMADPKRIKTDDGKYNYYSPSATMNEDNLPREVGKSSLPDCEETKNLQRYFGNHGLSFLRVTGSDKHTATMNEDNLPREVGKSSLPDCEETKNLQGYFGNHGLSFLRVTASDKHLADSIKDELKHRGIEPNWENRILLVGEWNSLYAYHLTKTFAAELYKEDTKNYQWEFNNFIFLASYLRGLDGEKQKADGGNDKPSMENNNPVEAKGEITENMEDASGDSQFDYVRRMATQIEEMDQEIREDSNDAHAIKAIGILGSDVYDKLLISEALQDKFPDAIIFTNGIDARFLEPKNNKWTRNMIMAPSFGLELAVKLQKDIPPFRDNVQTAFFLATQMALAKQLSKDKLPNYFLYQDDDGRSLLLTSKQNDMDKLLMPDQNKMEMLLMPDQIFNQNEMDKLLMPDEKMRQARIFEMGRTKPFNLSSSPACKTCLHPDPVLDNQNKKIGNIGFLVITIAVTCFVLLAVQASRQFLGRLSGLCFVFSMVFVSYAVLFSIDKALGACPRIGLSSEHPLFDSEKF